MNIPNLISIFRIFLIPVFIYSFILGQKDDSIVLPVVIFIISGISDILDGYIARTYNMKTDLGAVLDPLADKLMLMTALICFAFYKHIPIWLVILVGLKELVMILGGLITYREGIITPANAYGKIATLLFHISIITFLFSDRLAFILLIISVLVSFFALYNYTKITLDKRAKLKMKV